MRILYTYLIGSLLLGSSFALGQDLQSLPDAPTIKSSKATEPFLGVAVNIPLLKLFGKKKPKALPEQPSENLVTPTDSSTVDFDCAEIGTSNLSKAQKLDVGPLKSKETGQLPALGDLSVLSTDGT